MARGLSVITHFCLVPSLKFSGVISPLNLSPSMPHIGTLTLPPNYVPLPKAHFLSGIIGSFLYILISHMHTTGPIYLIFTDPITLTLRRVPITTSLYNFLCPSVVNSLYTSDILLTTFFSKSLKPRYCSNVSRPHFMPIKLKECLID